jgi:hypothetical protein
LDQKVSTLIEPLKLKDKTNPSRNWTSANLSIAKLEERSTSKLVSQSVSQLVPLSASPAMGGASARPPETAAKRLVFDLVSGKQ